MRLDFCFFYFYEGLIQSLEGLTSMARLMEKKNAEHF